MQTKHEIKQCPRCGRAFECKVNNPLHCQCMAVTLTVAQLESLQEQYEDCLCVDCLRLLAADRVG